MITVSCSGTALNAAVANALPSSVLSLAPGCTYVLAHGLPVINDTLGLQGPATLTLSARAKATGPILTVGASGNVTTDHVSFTGGNSSGGPGHGGAIDNDGGTIGVDFGNFSNNTASDNGGAIYNGSGTLRVFDATFTGNSAQQGGAIENFGTATITNADFSTNTAIGYGGAIENDGAANVYSSRFRANAAYSGGAAYNKNGSLAIFDSGIIGNQTTSNSGAARRNDAGEPTLGAGVANVARMTLKGDSIDGNGNGTTSRGGGVYNDGRAWLIGTTMSGNRAVAGGGFYNDGTASVIGSTIQANSTSHDGGGIYNFGPLTLTKTNIHGNHCGLDGGGMLNGAVAKVWGSQFYDNSAGIGGGGIHDYYLLKLTNTVLRDDKPDNCESRLGAKGCVRTPARNKSENQLLGGKICAGLNLADQRPVTSRLVRRLARNAAAIDRSASMVCASSGSHGPLSGPLGFQNVSRHPPPLAVIHSPSSANQSALNRGRGLLVSQMSMSGASRPLS